LRELETLLELSEDAPLPRFTSRTSAFSPSASFFDMMLAAIQRNRGDGARHVRRRTTAVGGGDLGRRPIIAQPSFITWALPP